MKKTKAKMNGRMSHVGIGLAALFVLAAEGKDFDREELNAMLERLAASPEPEVRRGPQATCYAMAMPPLERFEYVCGKCGAHTVYPANRNRMANTLARFRDEAASLRAFGLDIVLDESALCQKCNPFTQECWVSAKVISDAGELLVDAVEIRSAPKSDSKVLRVVSKYDFADWKPTAVNEAAGNGGARLRRLPARPGDPADWVRIDPVFCGLDRINELAWVINGKRTVVNLYDARILKAFLTGEKTWRGDFGDERSLKKSLPRLRQLLGTGDAPRSESGEYKDIKVETDL